ncbi:alpha/beta fold hydrolase [Iningainema tapete]|uniref:Alpha/beta hydrolase n=1 Tax=Iningainema tapete BLCC-T55 TaxID=2748662 RepID=A0A8J7CBV4_9CYAN|nr:alpha/beta hydrolase [Iningainema tapete]MBD2771960.1 alpha/beta hydrolase [Iningainema tapete BLCC-T55]
MEIYSEAEFNKMFTHHTATVGDVRLHYVIGGKGDPVVLLHGWPQTWYAWRKIMPALAQRYTVLAPDYRGAGDSSKPFSGYDKRTVADDIYALVQQLGYERINLVGHDLGMLVAYAYAAAHPEAVSRLVLLDSPLMGTTVWDQFATGPGAWHFAFHGTADFPEMLVTGREREYLTAIYKSWGHKPLVMTEEEIGEYVRAYSAPGALHAGFELYRAFPKDLKQFKELIKRQLPMPVLALGGETSAGPFIVDMVREAASDVRGGSVPHAGHWIAEENPDYLIQQLLTFFNEAK